MVVRFDQFDVPGIVNLAFGNALPDGSLNDLVRIGNNDRNKILATVVKAVYDYTSSYPEMIVYFAGSTPARNRLYRILVTLNLEELLKDFEIFGILLLDADGCYEKFEKQRPYTGFAVKRKKSNLQS